MTNTTGAIGAKDTDIDSDLDVEGSMDKVLYDPDITENLHDYIVKNKEPCMHRADESMYSIHDIHRDLLQDIENETVNMDDLSIKQIQAILVMADFIILPTGF